LPENKITPQSQPRTELSRFARRDLEEIWDYVNQDNSAAADALIKELLQKFKMLAQNPNLGKSRDEIIVNLRSFPLKRYIIFYVPNENGIEIFRVIHSSRNIEGLFEEFFENLT
jgi:toxin ParE1/3/4